MKRFSATPSATRRRRKHLGVDRIDAAEDAFLMRPRRRIQQIGAVRIDLVGLRQLVPELLDSDGVAVGFEGDEDADQVVAFGGEFEVGRPPGLKPGTPLDFPVAVNSTPLPLEPGRYEWRLTIDGASREDWTMPFTVRAEES